MFDFLKKLGRQEPDVVDRNAELQSLCDDFARLFVPQISNLGLKAGEIPPTGNSGLGVGSGYIFGLCIWLGLRRDIPFADERISTLHVWAFDEVYGLMIGYPLLTGTIERFQADDELVCRGVERAKTDLIKYLSDGEEPQGFFDFLSGGTLEQTEQTNISDSDIDAVYESIARSLISLLTPQLVMLGYQLMSVPAEGDFVSKRSRGYVFGLASAVASELTSTLTAEVVNATLLNAFELVYGSEYADKLLQLTLNESVSRDGEMLAGAYRAEDDVVAVYSGRPYSTVMGFWLLNNQIGDPSDKMPIISNPRPLPKV
jgi:hypothetical protein